MTPEQQRIAIAEACGWRRWRFGDNWKKGLRLSDMRFGGFIRRVIEDASADSATVKLDIDEAWTNRASEIVSNYIPVSHWVKGEYIKRDLPDYLNDLNAMHEAEAMLTDEQHQAFRNELASICGFNYDRCDLSDPNHHRNYVSSTAAQRAKAFGLTLNLWT